MLTLLRTDLTQKVGGITYGFKCNAIKYQTVIKPIKKCPVGYKLEHKFTKKKKIALKLVSCCVLFKNKKKVFNIVQKQLFMDDVSL